MRYRKLDASGDMVFGHGRSDYLTGVEAVAQSVLTRLRLWRREWYLDVNEGTPYTPEILGRGTESSSVSALQARILETPRVRKIASMHAEQDPETRRAVFTITVETDFGEVTIHG